MRPESWIDERKQVAALWFLFAVGVVVAVILGRFRPPGGWIPLELPALAPPGWVPPGEWCAAQREAALFGLGLDFLFLALYPLFLSLLCGRAGSRWPLPAWLGRTASWVSGPVLLACPLDAAENVGLYWLIQGWSAEGFQIAVTVVSAAKWILSLATLAVAVLCLGALLGARVQRSRAGRTD